MRRAGVERLIDHRAVIDPTAELAEDVTVGPFCVIGPNVRIDAGTTIGSHCAINGPTRIGRDNRIYAFACLGEAPQDKKYAGEATELIIGDRNTIREYCTLNRGTVQDRGCTEVGNDNWIMAYVHIAHDCVVGNETIMANGASLAGHVHIADHVVLGGFTLVHQFCRIGAHAFTAMGSAISRDVPPFVTVAGNPAKPHGINSEGLRRRGVTSERIGTIRQAYKTLYRDGHRLEEAIRLLAVQAEAWPDIADMVQFLASSERSIVR